LTIRNAICGVLLAAPTVAVLALIGWNGLGVVTFLLMLAMIRDHMVGSSPNGLVRFRDDMDGVCRSGNPSGAGGGDAGVGLRG